MHQRKPILMKGQIIFSNTKACIAVFAIGCLATMQSLAQDEWKTEKYRPGFHFSPKRHWMNDPNGLVFHNGVYHMFFQHYPNGTTWGPMHWGHAVSKDLLHWEEKDIALYPDSLGYIFSGSVVVDHQNSSGLGTAGKPPLVAIFTYHNDARERAKLPDFQYQGLAYSNDDGRTWKKYAGNPVLRDPGSTDFRDPKVCWHGPSGKWIMTLATKDRITFFTSVNLTRWEKASEFGKDMGAHGGVWECPDLFALELNGQRHWILLVSINPGAPNGGSGTQYFIGQFDGKTFTPYDMDIRWMDHGTDNYAGVTFSNITGRTVLLGWMSNWNYAQSVPTVSWRSAMTLPRELALRMVDGKLFLASKPVREFADAAVNNKSKELKSGSWQRLGTPGGFSLNMKGAPRNDISIELGNATGDILRIGYEKATDRFYVDRTGAGNVGHNKGFAARHYAPRISRDPEIGLEIIVDAASVEVFADDGLTVMTEIFFMDKAIDRVRCQGYQGTIRHRVIDRTL
jgi:fructan beta-fructosidase